MSAVLFTVAAYGQSNWAQTVLCDGGAGFNARTAAVAYFDESGTETFYVACEIRNDTGIGLATSDVFFNRSPSAYSPMPNLSSAFDGTGDTSYGSALAVGSGASAALVAAATNTGGACPGTERDSEELRVTKSSGAVASSPTLDNQHVSATCGNEGRKAITVDDGRSVVLAVWSMDPSAEEDDLYGAVRATSDAAWAGTPTLLVNGNGQQHHAQIAVRAAGGEKAVVYVDDNLTGRIGVRLYDADADFAGPIGGAMQINDAGAANFPSIYDRNGVLFVVWSEANRIYGRKCTASSGSASYANCDDVSTEWSSISTIDPGTANHVYSAPFVAVDSSGDQFVVFEDKDTSQAGNPTRVRLARVCGPGRTGQGAATQLVDNTQLDEEIGEGPLSGVPSITIDENNGIVAVSYIRQSSAGGNEFDGVVAHKDISALCQ